MANIITAVHGICVVFVFYLASQVFFEQKPTWRLFQVFLLLGSLGISYVVTGNIISYSLGLGVPRSLLQLARTILVCSFTTLPLQGTARGKAIFIAVAQVVGPIAEVLAYIVYPVITQQAGVWDINNLLTLESVITLSTLIAFIMVVVLRYARLEQGICAEKKHINWLELTVPAVSVVVMCFLIYLQRRDALYISILVLLTNILAFLVYDLYYKKAREHAVSEQLQQYKELHYREVEKHQAEIHMIRHDIKNQLIAMGAFVKAGEAGSADAQLSELITQLEDSGKYTFTEHAGVNGLLARKYQQAQDAGIRCDFQVALPRSAGFSDLDLTDLVGNILDNALEACQHCQGARYIHLEIDCQECVFLLRCINSTDGHTKSLKTRKTDAGHHGIGMKSIKQVVEKYNGNMEYSFRQGHFEIEISMFCPATV